MQPGLPFLRAIPPSPAIEPTAGRVEFVRVRAARRYILRVRPDGTLRVTIPRGGSRAAAAEFMEQHVNWIARERARVRGLQAPLLWTDGSAVLLDGEPAGIVIEESRGQLVARYGSRVVPVEDPGNVRPDVERDLQALARERLILRLQALSKELGLPFSRATIRNQSSRWGSCSRGGAIALNYRLVQMPPAVADYVLIHELMHLKQQNHGPRFWRLVERACPSFRDAERWLRRHGRSLF